MTTRVQARHRAAERPRTPLTGLGEAIGRRAVDAGRAGAVAAATGGLLVTVALPAGAAPAAAPAAVPAAVSTAVSAGLGTAVDSAFGTTPVGVVSAPAEAAAITTLTAFSAVPTPAPPPPPVVVERSTRSAVDAPAVEASVDQSVIDSALAVQAAAAAPAPVEAAPAPTPAPAPSLGQQILAVADDYVGVPYVYGGTTPAGFDCSGYTSYVLRQLGISVPRTANAQLGASARISRAEAVAGDLVFFTDGGRAYHVGIYAGDGMMWDAPRSGKPVQLRSVWSDSAVFGRVAAVA
ncbi:C40 family peptidase [Kineococcus sp. SYSU DK018]|uniref:C40 family peptidase n=1 Tax=Kineococcus sp. SYSU DK018 TaxID=3383139 RepID=UPI003D7DBEDC